MLRRRPTRLDFRLDDLAEYEAARREHEMKLMQDKEMEDKKQLIEGGEEKNEANEEREDEEELTLKATEVTGVPQCDNLSSPLSTPNS